MAKRDRPTDASSTSGSSTSDESTRKRKRSEKKNKKNGSKKHAPANSNAADEGEVAVDGYVRVNGTAAEQDALVPTNTFSTRRNSLGKAARDPRDEPSFKRRATEGLPPRQLTPVIDSDGLSRACKFWSSLRSFCELL